MPNYNSISPQQLAMMGRDGDTMLAHINEEEAMMLKQMGGRGTINPMTGLTEFAFGDDSYSYVSQDYGSGFDDYYDYGGGYGDYNNPQDLYDFNVSQGNNPFANEPGRDSSGALIPGYGATPPGVEIALSGYGGDDTSGYVSQDYGGGNDYIPPSNDYTVDETGNYTYNDYVAPVDTYVPPADAYVASVDTYVPPADTNVYVPPSNDYTVDETGAYNYNNYVPVVDTPAVVDTTPVITTGAVTPTQIANDAAASVIGGDQTLINDYVDKLSGSINNGMNNVVTIPGSGSTTTGLLDGYIPTETNNTNIVTGPVSSIPTTDTGNLVQIGDDSFLDTNTGAVVNGNGDVVLPAIDTTTGANTLVASANTGTTTDAGTGVVDLSGDGTKIDVSGTTITSDSYNAANVVVPAGYVLASSADADATTIKYDEQGNQTGFDGPAILMEIDGKSVWVKYDIPSILTGLDTGTTTGVTNTTGTTGTTGGNVGAVNPNDINIFDTDFSGSNVANLSGGSGANNVTMSNVTLGDANVANVTGGSNANVNLSNVTGGNLTGTSGPVIPGTGNITITDSTMGNIANINTSTSNLSVGNATTSNITNINSTLTTSNIANTIANNISNSTSNVSDTTISNTFANTIQNVLSSMSNANISNTTVGNISNSLSNISNTNISNTQANNISNVISLFTDGNISNSIVNTINNSVSNMNNVTISNTFANTINNVISTLSNANVSNTVVGNISNVISNVSNSNISNSIVNNITNSISNISNVSISNSTANTLSNVASNIANVIVANTTANIANIITTGNTVGNANGNANIATIVITANTLANANVVANILSNSNVISNSNSNTNANIIANILTNANIVANVLTNANVVANVLTNANIVANVLTNANITTNVISNVANTTSNVPYTGNVILGTGLNPGFMAPTSFYNTNDPAQSRFNWGQGGYQPGPTFNEVLYNQAAAPNTPFGLQQMAKPLSSQQIQDMIAGKEITIPKVAPATRKEQYVKGPVAPTYGQVMLNPGYKGTAATTGATSSGTTDAQFKQIADKLGPNWATDLQTAATNGNWDEYNRIQQLVNSILNPVIDRY